MAVDDHGLEVLKKAGEEVVPGSKADYYLKVKDITPGGPGASDPPSENPVTGDTIHESGVVGTSPIGIPVVPGGIISAVLAECPLDQTSSNELSISFDGGVKFKVLKTGSNLVWSPRGGITQVFIQGNVAGVQYEFIMNRNDP